MYMYTHMLIYTHVYIHIHTCVGGISGLGSGKKKIVKKGEPIIRKKSRGSMSSMESTASRGTNSRGRGSTGSICSFFY
jgi:hypothetical protein